MRSWISDLPIAVSVIVALIAGAGMSAAGLLLLHRLLPQGLRSTHNDVSGFMLGIVGVIYAVLLAFVAVAVWQDFGRAETLVQNEANLVADLYRDTIAFSDKDADAMRNSLFLYAEIVETDEWPGMIAGRTDESEGWQLLDGFHTQLIRLHTQDLGVTATQTEMLKSLNALYDARRGRFSAAKADMPAILWWNLIVGAVILMFYTCLFGVPDLMMHISMVSLLGGLIALVLLLIVLLNNPFRGQSHVSVEPFNRLVLSVEGMAYPHPPHP